MAQDYFGHELSIGDRVLCAYDSELLEGTITYIVNDDTESVGAMVNFGTQGLDEEYISTDTLLKIDRIIEILKKTNPENFI